MSNIFRLDDKNLIETIYKAAKEYATLTGKSFVFVGKNKKTEYFWFECSFHNHNFMHLLGIKSRTLEAEQFYLQCENHNNGEEAEITIGDCSPAGVHNRNIVNIKSKCCVELFHIENAKYMKVGNKNKINQHVDFEYAYGREYATLGFHKKGNGNAFPITCMTKGIDEYCTHKHKIVFI